MSKVLIEYNPGLPGSGKTQHIKELVARRKGKYVIVTDRVEVMQGRMNDIHIEASVARTNPIVIKIHAAHDKVQGASQNVRQEIRGLPTRECYQNVDHIVVFITH